MDLQTLWFILIAVLFTGFFVSRRLRLRRRHSAAVRRQRTTTSAGWSSTAIGPVWDGNEVWLLTAGGAMFAAFPNWYATLFSGFYLALFLILVALIVRGVAFEFRSKDDNPALARPVGRGDFHRQPAPGAAVGRRLRQYPARRRD